MTTAKRERLFLLLWETCNRKCSYCCNEQNGIGVHTVPVCKDVSGYDSIVFTGGEPMMFPDHLKAAIDHVAFNASDQTKLYMYTAMTRRPADLIDIIDQYLDGCTITLHEQADIEPFLYLYDKGLQLDLWEHKSMRLKLMEGVDMVHADALKGFEIIGPVTPLPECPMPADADFMAYNAMELRSTTVRWRDDMLNGIIGKCVNEPQTLTDEDIAGMHMITQGLLPAKAQASIAAHYRSNNGRIITYEEN